MNNAETIQIRPMQAEDVAACAHIMAGNALWQRYGVTPETALARFEKAFAEKASILVADSSGRAVGFCWYHLKGAFNRSGYIQLIGVDPACKGQGTGKLLLFQAEKIVMQVSDDMFLTVSDFNTSAQAFYQKLGYDFVGEIPDYVLPGITEKIMRKKLVREP